MPNVAGMEEATVPLTGALKETFSEQEFLKTDRRNFTLTMGRTKSTKSSCGYKKFRQNDRTYGWNVWDRMRYILFAFL